MQKTPIGRTNKCQDFESKLRSFRKVAIVIETLNIAKTLVAIARNLKREGLANPVSFRRFSHFYLGRFVRTRVSSELFAEEDRRTDQPGFHLEDNERIVGNYRTACDMSVSCC